MDAALKNGYKPTPTHIYSADGHDLGTRSVAQVAVDFSQELDVRSLLVSDKARPYLPLSPHLSPPYLLHISATSPLHLPYVSKATLSTVAEFLDDERVMVEPLCAVALAALYGQPELFKQFESVVVIVCGGSLCSLDEVTAWRRKALGP